MTEYLKALKNWHLPEKTEVAFINATIFTGYDVLSDMALIVKDGVIVKLCPVVVVPDAMFKIDLNGANISAGFTDLQLNGCGGVMFNSQVSVETLEIMHQTNLKSGCTRFLPTLITCSDEDMKHAIKVMRDYQLKYPDHLLGLHLEGPYISLEKKGIHNAAYVRKPSDEMIDYLCAHAAQITLLTLAPEVCSASIVERLVDAGIVVSIGHSNASYKQAKISINAGAGFATHLFNAMSTMQGREPGMVGAIYNSPCVYTGVIADGIHVDLANIRIAKKIKQDHLILVTDATAAAGASDLTSFDFVGETVFVKNGRCVNKDGTIGGSALTLNQAIANVVRYVGVSLEEAVRMVTLYPAQAIHRADKMGQLKAGFAANLSIFDANMNILATLVDGKLNQ